MCIAITKNFSLTCLRDWHNQNAIRILKKWLIHHLNLRCNITNNALRIMNLIHTILNAPTVFSNKFWKFCACFIIRNIIWNVEHFMKNNNKEILASYQVHIDTEHTHSYTYFLFQQESLVQKFLNIS